jgi:REP-associated tyrosine transposase
MVRQGRRYVPQGTYYVIDQFRGDRDILVATPARKHSASELRQIEANRAEYERLLNQAVLRSRIRIHAYCWLPDRAHLLVQVRFVPLKSVMQTLRGSFSRYLKKHADLREAVYPERYRAILVDPDDDFFFDVCRVIVTSPVRAKLCRRLQDYEYSSLHSFIGGAAPDFLTESAVTHELAIRGIDTSEKIARFFIAPTTPGFRVRLARGQTLGSPLFLRQLRRSHHAARVASLDLIVGWVAHRYNLQPEIPMGEAPAAEAIEAQTLAAWIATSMGTISLAKAAQSFGCSKSTLHRRIARLLSRRLDLATAATLEDCIRYLDSLELEAAEEETISAPFTHGRRTAEES